jgi:ribose-phosphate pyrophosphokinase
MIKLFKDNVRIQFKQWKFPGGEIGVQLPVNRITHGSYLIQFIYENSDDMVVFLNLCDALKELDVGEYDIRCEMSYLPYARQDRACNPGESNSLVIFVKMLQDNHCGRYFLCDVHSKVGTDLFDRFGIQYTHKEQWQCAENLPAFDIFIAPDAGATSKIVKQCQHRFGTTKVICLTKTRIDGLVVYNDLTYDTVKGDVCVVDDLCDGGATFLVLGEMLRRTQPNIKSLGLYVTHGIFSKGTEKLKSYYDDIFTFNLMNKSVEDQVNVL